MTPQFLPVGQYDGKLLLAVEPSMLEKFTHLLEYYKENEEQKKRQAATGKEYVTPEQLASIVGLATKTVREWCATGGILAPAASKLSNRIRIEKNEALRLIDDQKHQSREERDQQELSALLNSTGKKKRKRFTEA